MMIDKYIIPNFNNLKPIKIMRASENVKQSKYYDRAIESKPNDDRFYIAFYKFMENYELDSKHYKVLLFFLDEIEKQNYFNQLYDSFLSKIEDFRAYRGFIRPLTSYIYDSFGTNIVSVYELLRIISLKLKDNKRYSNIKDICARNNTYEEFLNDIKKEFYNVKSNDEIEQILKSVFMSRNDKFYLKCRVRFIIDNHLNKEFIESFKQDISRMDLETKKEVFVGILEIYKHENDIDKYPKEWFFMILEHLGEPYSKSNTKWNDIDDNLKEIFRLWNNNENIYNFFINEATDADQTRLNFWKKYINSIYRIRYYPNLNKALVMEFKNHLFVEFAQHSNALYYYNKSIKNIDMIDASQNQEYGNLSIYYLKDKNLGNRLFHRSNWEYDFEFVLKRLNYNKGGW